MVKCTAAELPVCLMLTSLPCAGHGQIYDFKHTHTHTVHQQLLYLINYVLIEARKALSDALAFKHRHIMASLFTQCLHLLVNRGHRTENTALTKIRLIVFSPIDRV